MIMVHNACIKVEKHELHFRQEEEQVLALLLAPSKSICKYL